MTRDANTIKEVKRFGMPWEKEYGYSQAVKVGDTVYLSGQISHDADGNIVGPRDMEVQMRQAYANVKCILSSYGMTFDDIVSETLFVTNIDAAYKAHAKMFGGSILSVASTIVQIEQLVFPELMIELKCIAVASSWASSWGTLSASGIWEPAA